MPKLLLALNAGSSSLKLAIFDRDSLRPVYRASADFHTADATLEIASPAGTRTLQLEAARADAHRAAVATLCDWLHAEGLAEQLAGAGHRVVTGGTEFTRPVAVDARSLQRMHRLTRLAPLHLPHNLSAIDQLRELMPDLPQVACFDTAFHAGQSPLARAYALPAAVSRKGCVRYGFHGLSYEYVVSRLPHLFGATANGRVVIAHLGNGASLCAVHDGRSVATTLGYSTLDGLVMGTRCGALDPGLVLELVRAHDGDVDAVEHMLYHESGLLGVSGISSDMRDLLASSDPRAAFAVDLFVYRIGREFGSLAAALGGVDAVVFTGGIGARSATIRRRVAQSLHWLGARLDDERNDAGNERIEHADSRLAIAAVTTDEEFVVARAVRSIIDAPRS